MTNLFLASAEQPPYEKILERTKNPFNLYSFYYIEELKNFKFPDYCKRIMVDSGAHTLQYTNNSPQTYQAFFERYVNFIKQHKDDERITFIELDIDNVIGWDKLQQWRETLLSLRDDMMIVWHKWSENLAKRDLWEEYVNQFKFISIPNKDMKNINVHKALDLAREKGIKVHGLAMTKPNLPYIYKFTSIDSSTWASGGRFGNMYMFRGNKLVTINTAKINTTKLQYNDLDYFNALQWKKLSNYMEGYNERV